MSTLVQTGAEVDWAGFNSRTAIVAGVALGDTIIVENTMCNFGTGISTIGCSTVNDGSAYTLDANITNGVTGAPLTVEIWRLHNAAAGTHNIVLTSNHANSNNFGRIIAYSVNGLQNAAPDVTKTNTGNSTTPQTGSSAALSQSGEFVVAGMVLATTVGSPAFTSPANTGYTSIMNKQTTPNMPASADYKHVTATTALSADWGTIAGSEQWAALLAAYKDVVAGGAPTITSVTSSGNPSGTIQQGQTLVTITGTNFGSNTGSAAVTLIDGGNSSLTSVCAPTSWGATSVQFTANSGNVRNGAATIQLTTSGGLTVTFGVTLIPPTGTTYGTFGAVKALTLDPNGRPSRLTDTPDIGNGESWEMTTSAGTGVISVLPDGNMTWPIGATQGTFRHHNGIQYSALSHWDLRGPFPVFSGLIPTQNGANGTALTWDLSGAFSQPDPAAAPLTYSIVGNALPAGLGPINSSTGVVAGTPSATGTTTGLVVQAMNAEGSYVQSNAFSAVIAANTTVSFTGTIADSANLTVGDTVNINATLNFLNATTYTKTGTLPDGLVFSAGVISGVLTGVGITVGTSVAYPIFVTGSNANPSSANSNTFTLTVSNPIVVVVVPNAPTLIKSTQLQFEESVNTVNTYRLDEAFGSVTLGVGDVTGQIYRVCRIHSAARVTQLQVQNESITGGQYKIGVALPNGGNAVLAGSDAIFVPSITLDTGRITWADIFFPTIVGAAGSLVNVGKRVWELLGLSSDPSPANKDVYYDLILTTVTPGSNAGVVNIRVLGRLVTSLRTP